jgi:hypothetical protein
MPCPTHPPWLDHSNCTWRRVMKLFFMQFSTSCHFIPFGPNILFSTLLNTLSLCSSLNVRVQVSHPYRTTGEIRVLYILLFTFLNSRREHESSWTEQYQAFSDFNLHLISSWIQFWFVTVVPKYLNYATFSKDPLAAVVLIFPLHSGDGFTP